MLDNKTNVEILNDIARVLSDISEEYVLISVDRSEVDNVKVYSKFVPKTLLLTLVPHIHKDLEKKFLKDKCKSNNDENTSQTRSEEQENTERQKADGVAPRS